MSNRPLSNAAKIAIVLGLLASFTLLIMALVTFVRERDWPARYVSAAVTILAVMFILRKRRRRRSS